MVKPVSRGQTGYPNGAVVILLFAVQTKVAPPRRLYEYDSRQVVDCVCDEGMQLRRSDVF